MTTLSMGGLEMNDRLKVAVDGALGKIAIIALGSILMGLSVWVLTTVLDHNSELIKIGEDVHHLVGTVEGHNKFVDEKIGEIVNVENELGKEVTALKAAEAYRDGVDHVTNPAR